MTSPNKYYIGSNLLGEIRSTIRRVDAIAPRTSGPAGQVAHQELQRPSREGEPIFVGSTIAGDWEYDTVRTIAVEGGFSPDVRNLLINVRLPDLAFVTFARIGDEYQVVQFRLQDIGGYDATAGSLKVLGIREGWMEWIGTQECPTEEA